MTKFSCDTCHDFEGRTFKVRSVHGGKLHLSLNGMVLSCCGADWGRRCTIEVPCELAHFLGKKRRDGKILIYALLLSAFAFFLGFIINLFFPGIVGGLIICAGVLISFAIVVSGVVRFLIPRQTLAFCVDDDQRVDVSFWLDESNKTELSELVAEVDRRKLWVTSSMSQAVVDCRDKPWGKTACLTLLMLIPAGLFERPWLLLLGVVPVTWHVLKWAFLFTQPSEFRRATACCNRGNYRRALQEITPLTQAQPDHMRAKLLMLELLITLKDFDRAAAVLYQLHNYVDPDDLRDMESEIMARKNIAARKHRHLPSAQ